MNGTAEPFQALRAASYPHPYPEGWYRLALSKSLRRGDVRGIDCLGRRFVIWREQNRDAIHVMDASCPHLGANLASGRVRGDCIECPFHGWRFTGDGRTAHIPYCENPPDRVLAEPYPVQDIHGQLFVYFRGDRSRHAAKDPPPYDVPRIPEVDEGRFVWRGHHNVGRVRIHVLEIAENAGDTAHFQTLHSQFCLPWTKLRVPGVEIRHTTEWSLDSEKPWMLHYVNHAALAVRGRRLDAAAATTRVRYCGPGSVLIFRFDIPGRGEIAMYLTLLPIGPLEQQIDFRWFADRKLPRMLVWYVIGTWASQLKHDVEIWSDKVYSSRPMLCRDDGPVAAVRRWYQQFLPETPPSAQVR